MIDVPLTLVKALVDALLEIFPKVIQLLLHVSLLFLQLFLFVEIGSIQLKDILSHQKSYGPLIIAKELLVSDILGQIAVILEEADVESLSVAVFEDI